MTGDKPFCKPSAHHLYFPKITANLKPEPCKPNVSSLDLVTTPIKSSILNVATYQRYKQHHLCASYSWLSSAKASGTFTS